MNYSHVIFIFLMAHFGRSQKRSFANDQSNLYGQNVVEEGKSPGEIWQKPNQFVVPNKFSRSDEETDPNGQEAAKEEKILADFVSTDPIQNIFIKLLNPKPIVDTASPRELNSVSNGNQADVLGELVIKGSNALSKAINSMVEAPKQAFNTFSKKTTEALNQLGAYIVGL